MDTKEILCQLRNRKRTVAGRTGRKSVCDKAGGVPLGKRGNDAQCGNAEAAVQRFFDVSINTLLGSPRKLICQCCGMPLDDSTISKETDGSFNEEYCKWCYTDGEFKYESKEQLIDFCVEHMANESWPAEQVRAHMEAVVPYLNHWKK